MPEVSEKLQGVINTIKELSVVELVELVDALKNELGLSDADLQGGGGVVMAAGGAAGGGAAEAAEEPTEFNVILADTGADKIKVLKVVRTVTGLGLAEAKKFVESAPQTVKEGVSKDEAAEIKKQLEEAGAKVEVKGA